VGRGAQKIPLFGVPYQQFYYMISKLDKKSPFLGSALTISSCNIQGINSNKEELLADSCKDNLWDVLCVQETYRKYGMNTPKINGMKFVTL